MDWGTDDMRSRRETKKKKWTGQRGKKKEKEVDFEILIPFVRIL